MSRRRESESQIRKLNKNGPYTYYVTIPKREIDRLGWREKQKLVVTPAGRTLIIRDWKRPVKRPA